jgi:hypothetical protein
MRRRDPDLLFLKTDPLMDPLRKEPRFQAVMPVRVARSSHWSAILIANRVMLSALRTEFKELEMTRAYSALAMVLLSATAICEPAVAVNTSLRQTAEAFMDAYVRGDWSTVERFLSPRPLYVYGSDISEFATDASAFKRMFEADQKLWRGAARWGEMSQVSSFQAGPVATLFFNRVFELGVQRITVRFSTVWHREHSEWKLIQSSNAVPTMGQSASELLAKPQH